MSKDAMLILTLPVRESDWIDARYNYAKCFEFVAKKSQPSADSKSSTLVVQTIRGWAQSAKLWQDMHQFFWSQIERDKPALEAWLACTQLTFNVEGAECMSRLVKLMPSMPRLTSVCIVEGRLDSDPNTDALTLATVLLTQYGDLLREFRINMRNGRAYEKSQFDHYFRVSQFAKSFGSASSLDTFDIHMNLYVGELINPLVNNLVPFFTRRLQRIDQEIQSAVKHHVAIHVHHIRGLADVVAQYLRVQQVTDSSNMETHLVQAFQQLCKNKDIRTCEFESVYDPMCTITISAQNSLCLGLIGSKGVKTDLCWFYGLQCQWT